jgi:hypothetical protein
LTREEVAAVTAVAIALEQQRAEAAAAVRSGADPEQLNMWVEASRRSAQRALLQRGPWRLSGRLGRRSRT